MLTFETEAAVVAVADVAERTIEGTVAPYGEVGVILGRRYRFAPGSLTAARARTPFLVDHDRSSPIGVLAELSQTPAAALGRFNVDATPAGDLALVQAASGSRGAFSVGFELDEAVEGDDGVVDVAAARIVEVSLLALGAFEGASVERVAAEADETTQPEPEPELEPNPDQGELPLDPETTAAPPPEPEEAPMSEASDAAPVIRAVADRTPRELQAGELVELLVRAQHGEPDARRYLEAALVESISSDVSGLLPPTYERTVIGERQVDRPLYNAFRGRALPGVGLQIVKPKWATHTAGAEAANVDADATSTKVTISSQTASVVRWDWAGAIPWVVVQRSDPSVIDEIYADAVQGFYLYVDGKVGGQLNTAAAGTSVTIGAALAEFYIATGKQRTAEVIVMAPDVWGKFADKSALSSAIIVGPVSGAGGFSATLAGIPVVVSGTLA